jgi:hypothetical protein
VYHTAVEDQKMLKYMKRRHIDEDEDSENKSDLSEPNTSKAGREMTDYKNLPLQ